MNLKRLFALLLTICITCGSAFAENKFVKVVFVGDLGSGKTCIWKRLLDEGFNENERGSDRLTFNSIIRTDGEDVLCITLWDTAGADRYYDEVVDFTRDANFVFIVHDLYKKLNGDVKVYLSRIYRDVHERMAPGGRVVLVGSKYDLRHRDIANAAEQANLLKEVAENIPCPYVLTSAKEDGDPGIATLLNYIVEQCRVMQLPNHSSRGSTVFSADIPAPAPAPAPQSSGWGCIIA